MQSKLFGIPVKMKIFLSCVRKGPDQIADPPLFGIWTKCDLMGVYCQLQGRRWVHLYGHAALGSLVHAS